MSQLEQVKHLASDIEKARYNGRIVWPKSSVLGWLEHWRSKPIDPPESPECFADSDESEEPDSIEESTPAADQRDSLFSPHTKECTHEQRLLVLAAIHDLYGNEYDPIIPKPDASAKLVEKVAHVAKVHSIIDCQWLENGHGLEVARDWLGSLTVDMQGEDVRPVEQYVTLDQAAAVVSRSKVTLRRRYDEGDLPEPDVQGKGGSPHEWKWSRLRPVLIELFKRDLPERYPAR